MTFTDLMTRGYYRTMALRADSSRRTSLSQRINYFSVVKSEAQPVIHYMIILTENKKGFDKIQHSLIIKILRKIAV